MTTANTNDFCIIGKIAIAQIGCKPRNVVKTEKAEAIAHIYGRASELKQYENKNDGTTGYALLGSFEAVNLQDGTTYRSGKCFLPSTVHNMVVAQLSGENASDAVDFAFEIWAKPEEKSTTGYVYEVKPLIKPSAADPLEAMRTQIAERSAKQLPAHTEEKKQAAGKK